MSDSAAAAPWWGEFQIPHGSMGRWRIGPRTIWIERMRGEWRVASITGEDDMHGDVSVKVPIAAEDTIDLLELDDVLRFGVSGEDERITLTPRLADRLVVTTPVKPFYIPAGETVTVFVGSPLWLEFATASTTLHEFPIFRPSDTWFGNNTRSGELGYASRTACRLRFEEFQVEPHRAVTAVTVYNKARSSLLLERMKLPVEYLPLFTCPDGIFWTRDLHVYHRDGNELSSVEPGPEQPQRAVEPQLISEPRIKSDVNLAMRIFASLFG